MTKERPHERAQLPRDAPHPVGVPGFLGAPEVLGSRNVHGIRELLDASRAREILDGRRRTEEPPAVGILPWPVHDPRRREGGWIPETDTPAQTTPRCTREAYLRLAAVVTDGLAEPR